MRKFIFYVTHSRFHGIEGDMYNEQEEIQYDEDETCSI